MNFKTLAIGGGCFSVGAIFAWAVTADYYDEKLKRNAEVLTTIIDRQATDISNLIHETKTSVRILAPVAAEEDLDVELDQLLVTDEENSPEEIFEELSESEQDARIAKSETLLQSMISQYTADPEAVEIFSHNARPAAVDMEPPFVISHAKWSWDEDEGDVYEKAAVEYYPTPRILLDEDQEVISGIDEILGWKNLLRFGDESDHPDIVYIRNRRLHTDYEVVRNDAPDPPAHVRYGMTREQYAIESSEGGSLTPLEVDQ